MPYKGKVLLTGHLIKKRPCFEGILEGWKWRGFWTIFQCSFNRQNRYAVRCTGDYVRRRASIRLGQDAPHRTQLAHPRWYNPSL